MTTPAEKEKPTEQKKKTPAHALVMIWVSVFFTSLVLIFVRISSCPTLVLAAWRKTMAAAILLPVVLARPSCRRELRCMDRRTLLWCVLGGCFMGVHFWTYFLAAQNTTIAATQVLASTEVIFVALFMLVFSKVRLGRRGIAAVAVVMAGSVLTAFTPGGIRSGSTLFGNLLALICAVMISCYLVLGSKIRSKMSGLVYTFISYASAAVLLNVLVLFSPYSFTGYDRFNYLLALAIAVTGSLLGYGISNWALKYLSPTLISMVRSFQPVLAATWAFLVFSEKPSWNQFAGGVVVIAGILLYVRHKGTQGSSSPKK